MSGIFSSFGHIAPKTLEIPEVMSILLARYANRRTDWGP